MSDIGTWLNRHGLGQHAALFAAHDIDLTKLPTLTDGDLRDLGLSLGHRRRLLGAIGGMKAPPVGSPEIVPEAERRQLTVMFCEFVDSADSYGGFTAGHDPEDLSETIRVFRDAAAEAITRFQGVVAKFMGNGMLAYFGFPRAHEDDAEQAIRAGLGIVAAVGRLAMPDGTPLRVRVGIATGLVVVGDLIGRGEAQERAVIGETPNLAARLQALAESDAILVAAATRQLAGGLFDYTDLGPHRLKGIAEPVPVWRVTGESHVSNRFDAKRTAALTGFVGRASETAVMLGTWEQAKTGEGRVLLITGEPGIGKSRLIALLQERIRGEPHIRLRLQCSPHHSGSVLYPVIDQIRRAARIAADDPPETRLDRLDAMLDPALTGDDRDRTLALYAALLSVPAGDRLHPLAMAPERRKELTLKALTDRIVGLSERSPVLWVVEDAHWMDPTTLELLKLGMERTRNARVLIAVTARPEFGAPWQEGHDQVTTLPLSRLTPAECIALAERATGGKALPDIVLDQILSKTDGIPLFIEELAKTVLESGLLREEADRFMLDGLLPPPAIPTTLHDSLMARLDRLAPVRHIAQTGAALGREFSYEVLEAVVEEDPAALRAALDQLVRAELLFEQGTPPDATYIFKHALVQDTAYGSLLRVRRQELHARIAAVLESRFPQIAETEPELLAHHFAQGGVSGSAMIWWRRAGKRAARDSAHVEATNHLGKALTLAATQPASGERDELELDLCIELGTSVMMTRGHASPECRDLFIRARALCERIGDTPKFFPVLYGEWSHAYVSSRVTSAVELAEQFLRRAERADDQPLTMVGNRILGASLLAHGAAEPALRYLRRALAGYDPDRHRVLAFLYVQNHQVTSLVYTGFALGHLGFAEQSVRVARQAVELAEASDHFNTLAFTLYQVGFLHLIGRRASEAADTLARLLQLAQEKGTVFWATLGRAMASCAVVQQNPTPEGVAQLHRDIEAGRALGWSLSTFIEIMGAEALGKVGDPEVGLRRLDEAQAFLEKAEQRLPEADCHRVRADLLLALGAPDEAIEASLRRAIDIARAQNGRTFELRAATRLARLWLVHGRGAEARALLEPVYDWFTEGIETDDLREARALLDALRLPGDRNPEVANC
jgi:class 3 adenylate cyclase/predicted ATPase